MRQLAEEQVLPHNYEAPINAALQLTLVDARAPRPEYGELPTTRQANEFGETDDLPQVPAPAPNTRSTHAQQCSLH